MGKRILAIESSRTPGIHPWKRGARQKARAKPFHRFASVLTMHERCLPY